MPTFDTPEPISVAVEFGVGDLQVAASDRVDTVVEVEPNDPSKPSDVAAAAKTTVEYGDGVLRIRAPKGWRRYSFRGGAESIVARIQLPTGSNLRAEAGLAHLRCSGILGDCRYRAGAGDITIEQISGDTELTTGSGAVAVDGIGGSAIVKNGNGDTWIGEVVGDLQVKASNGKVAVDHAHAAVTARTANGDIHLDEVAGGAVVAETACGRVDIAVRSGVAAWLDLHTGFGNVRNQLDVGARPGPTERTVEVRARSACGDIAVRRADVGSGQGVA
ncbi:MAG: DUF4097 family beta strand repeat-containing protein [Acidimicrobiales bacterium]|jgi:hypothetical protein